MGLSGNCIYEQLFHHQIETLVVYPQLYIYDNVMSLWNLVYQSYLKVQCKIINVPLRSQAKQWPSINMLNLVQIYQIIKIEQSIMEVGAIP